MSDQTVFEREQPDLVFNAETCRALRRDLWEFTRVVAVCATFYLGMLGISVIRVVAFPQSAVAEGIVAVISLMAVIAVMKWFNLLPTREELRKLPGLIVALRNPEDDGQDSAVPALAAGRSGADWMIILGLPLVLLLRVIIVHDARPLLLGGCIALGGVLFLIINTNTYPLTDASEVEEE